MAKYVERPMSMVPSPVERWSRPDSGLDVIATRRRLALWGNTNRNGGHKPGNMYDQPEVAGDGEGEGVEFSGSTMTESMCVPNVR